MRPASGKTRSPCPGRPPPARGAAKLRCRSLSPARTSGMDREPRGPLPHSSVRTGPVMSRPSNRMRSPPARLAELHAQGSRQQLESSWCIDDTPASRPPGQYAVQRAAVQQIPAESVERTGRPTVPLPEPLGPSMAMTGGRAFRVMSLASVHHTAGGPGHERQKPGKEAPRWRSRGW